MTVEIEILLAMSIISAIMLGIALALLVQSINHQKTLQSCLDKIGEILDSMVDDMTAKEKDAEVIRRSRYEIDRA